MSGRGRAEVALRAGLLVLLGACTPEVAVPDDLSIRCDGRDECPAGYHCELSIGRCVLDGTRRTSAELKALTLLHTARDTSLVSSKVPALLAQ